MGVTGEKGEAALLVAATLTVTLFFLYGYVTRPEIYYSVSTEVGYNETFDFGLSDIEVGLEIRNGGASPVDVLAKIGLYNMSLVSPEGGDVFPDEDYTEVRIHLEEPVPGSQSGSFTVKVRPSGSPQYLVFVFKAAPDLSGNPLAGFHNSFAVFNPERPTAIMFRKVEGMKYMRVKSR